MTITIQKPKIRQWGLVGPAQSGKSTFVAANAEPPVFVVDSDNRYDAVQDLGGGMVHTATPRASFDPLTLDTELEEAAMMKRCTSFVFDSATKLYAHHSRKASMRGRLDGNERQALGLNKNKASDQVSKADVMAVIGNAAMYGHCYYIWHRGEGINIDTFKMVDKETISKVELTRLETSLNMKLLFECVGGVYQVRVEFARDYAGRKANTGFVIQDFPGNFWRGGAERIEELVYAHFSGPEEAQNWGKERLGVEVTDLYNDVKAASNPKSAREMFFHFVKRVQIEAHGRSNAPNLPQDERRPENGQSPTPEPPRATEIATAVSEPESAPIVPEEEPAIAESAPLPPPEPPADDFDTMFPPSQAEPSEFVPEPDGMGNYRYAGGFVVEAADVNDYLTYCRKFKKRPFDAATMEKAVTYGKQRGTW